MIKNHNSINEYKRAHGAYWVCSNTSQNVVSAVLQFKSKSKEPVF
jgi:hypothetical protein